MNDLKFNCPHCKQFLEAPEEMFGQTLDCPSCKKQIQVPKSQIRQAPQTIPQNVTVEVKRGASPLGIAALVLGILACLICWIPFVGLLSIPLSLIGLLLGFIGLIMAAINKKTGFAFPVSGGLVCMISMFIAFSITGGIAKAISDAKIQKQRTNQSTVLNEPSTPEVPKTSEIKENEQPKTQNKPEPTKSAEEWSNAANPVKQGDIQVQIKSVKVGKIALKSMFGDSQESKDELLAITVDISNLSSGKK